MNTKEKHDIKYAFGITSICKDGNHIFMSDIDEDINIENVLKICYDILNKYFLHYIVVLESTHGYNIFSLDKMPLKLVHQINSRYPSIDQQFNNIAFNTRKFYVLRMGSDKHVIWKHENNCKPLFVQSNAHRIFFNNILGIDLPSNGCFDDSETFRIIRFRCPKYGVEMNDC